MCYPWRIQVSILYHRKYEISKRCNIIKSIEQRNVYAISQRGLYLFVQCECVFQKRMCDYKYINIYVCIYIKYNML